MDEKIRSFRYGIGAVVALRSATGGDPYMTVMALELRRCAGGVTRFYAVAWHSGDGRGQHWAHMPEGALRLAQEISGSGSTHVPIETVAPVPEWTYEIGDRVVLSAVLSSPKDWRTIISGAHGVGTVHDLALETSDGETWQHHVMLDVLRDSKNPFVNQALVHPYVPDDEKGAEA